MATILTRCLAHDTDEDWTDLWMVFDQITAIPLRRIFTQYGFDQHEADDVVMDIWRHLLEADKQRLRSFKGKTIRELKVWLVRVAINFTKNWISQRMTSHHREQRAISALAVPDRSGPTEPQISQLLDDLRAVAGDTNVKKLRILAGLDESGSNVPPRTIRRWAGELQQRFGKHF